MGEQGHDEHDKLCRGVKPIEDRPFGGAEGPATLLTDEPLLLTRMDANIALAGSASGMALLIGAEYSCGVHHTPPSFAGTYAKRSMLGPLFSLQANDTTI
jgi:hypothetical protein